MVSLMVALGRKTSSWSIRKKTNGSKYAAKQANEVTSESASKNLLRRALLEDASGATSNAALGEALADAMKSNSALTTLQLNGHVGDVRGVALCEALKSNMALKTLIFQTSVSDAAGVALGEALKSNTVLT